MSVDIIAKRNENVRTRITTATIPTVIAQLGNDGKRRGRPCEHAKVILVACQWQI